MDGERNAGCTEDVPHADFELFVKAHFNSLFLPVARRYTGFRWIPDAALDVAQEALARAWPKWVNQLSKEFCQRRCAWVCKTMSHIASEEHRKRRARPMDPSELPDLAAPGPGPEGRYLVSELVGTVARAMRALSDTERLIIDLAIAKVPHAEIAVQLDLSSPTHVSTKLHRARVHLAMYLDPDLLAELGLRTDLNPPGGVA